MKRKHGFEFRIYRLNLFKFFPSSTPALPGTFNEYCGDKDLKKILKHSTHHRLDELFGFRKVIYKWSAREYRDYSKDYVKKSIVGITLARSAVEREGQTVTDSGIEETVLHTHPPRAIPIHLMFYLDRHLVAVEYSSEIMNTNRWLNMLHKIFDSASHKLMFNMTLKLEPIAKDREIIKDFNSFSPLMMMKVHLRLPNPDLSPVTKVIYDEMMTGGIQDYILQMENPDGLNQDQRARPYAAVALAQDGYKEGKLTMTGIRNERIETISSGKGEAAKGFLSYDYEEFQKIVPIAIEELTDEIDQIISVDESENNNEEETD